MSAPGLSAEVLLAHALQKPRTYFYAHPEQELREVEWIHYGRYLHERINGKPTQYITRKQEFYGREFTVSPDVLIPRPETELLVETALNRCSPSAVVIDIGTGSGAVAITLKLEKPGCSAFATDLSPGALAIAKLNAAKHNANVHFLRADLLAAFPESLADIIVSNPPYVPLRDLDTLQREVRDWEPHLALFAGESGTAIYQRLIPEAHRVLKPGGCLILELGFGQSEEIAALTAEWRNLRILPDLAGIPRVLICEKP